MALENTGTPGYVAQTGGTSVASPLAAGFFALISGVVGSRLGGINPTLYQLGAQSSAGFHDIVSGNNTCDGVNGFSAGPGYDEVTGLGSLDVALLLTQWPGYAGTGTTGTTTSSTGSTGGATGAAASSSASATSSTASSTSASSSAGASGNGAGASGGSGSGAGVNGVGSSGLIGGGNGGFAGQTGGQGTSTGSFQWPFGETGGSTGAQSSGGKEVGGCGTAGNTDLGVLLGLGLGVALLATRRRASR